MNSKTAEEIRSEIANLKGELAALAGEGLEVWNGLDGGVADTPEGGATLTVEWAISDRSYMAWYPTTEAAKAALLKVAADNHCVPSDDGFYVDLTAQGCHSSKAYVTRRQEAAAQGVSLTRIVDILETFASSCATGGAAVRRGESDADLDRIAAIEGACNLLLREARPDGYLALTFRSGINA